MLLIKDKESYDRNHELINQFSVIYNQAFPDENEREELSAIYNRLCVQSKPFSFIIFDVQKGIVQGGLIIDVYTEVEVAHLIYIVTDPEKRRQGIAKRLLKTYLPAALHELDLDIETVIFESNNPQLTLIDSFDTNLRLDIFRRLGAKRIPINYIQPPLEGRTQRVDNLFLFVYTKQDYIDTFRLEKFIGDFYRGLGVVDYEKNNDYIATINSLKENSINNKIFLV